MSDDSIDYAAHYDRLAGENLRLQSENADLQGRLDRLAQANFERLADNASAKAAAILEGERRQFHHDVLCLVLKELVGDVLKERVLGGTLVESVPRYVELARLFADLAYPPPKGVP